MIQVLLYALIVGTVLGFLGAGGSVLTVPIFVYGLGFPEKSSIAMSLGSVGLISIFGTYLAVRRGEIMFSRGIVFAAFSMVGSYAGASLGTITPSRIQLMIFGVIMLVAAYFMLNPLKAKEEHTLQGFWAWLRVGLSGVVIGVLTGLVGVGGGFLVVPALIFLAGVPIKVAVGTSLFVISLQSFSGFARYLQSIDLNPVEWRTIFIFAGVGALGSIIGSFMNQKVNAQKLRRLFGYFLVVIALFVIAKESHLLG